MIEDAGPIIVLEGPFLARYLQDRVDIEKVDVLAAPRDLVECGRVAQAQFFIRNGARNSLELVRTSVSAMDEEVRDEKDWHPHLGVDTVDRALKLREQSTEVTLAGLSAVTGAVGLDLLRDLHERLRLAEHDRVEWLAEQHGCG
jgi:hypothetical protein